MKKKQVETREESVLSEFEVEPEESQLPAESPQGGSEPNVPLMSDPAWQEYVMGLFSDTEKDPRGNPRVTGLRRVARLILGPLTKSIPRVVRAPEYVQVNGKTQLNPTTVEHSLTFLCTRGDDGEFIQAESTFGGCADVYYGNTDKDFSRFPTAMAATRAEARAYKNALGLARVAAEELAEVPAFDEPTGKINETQISFLDNLCRRLNVDVMGYVNMGSKKFANIEDIPSELTAKMFELLSGWQNDAKQIPDKIRGYKPNWKAKA